MTHNKIAMESFARTIEEELTCPICLDIFVEPKILPGCAHVCCEDCIRQMLKESKTASIDCPECRKEVSLTMGRVAKLKTNFRLRNMANKHSRDGDVKGCDGAGVAICSKHEDEKMHLYCVSCNVMVCQLCFLESHGGSRHSVVGVRGKYKQQKVEMNAILKQTRTNVEKERKLAQEVQHAIEDLEVSQEKEQKRIDVFIQREINSINAHAQTLHADLRKAGRGRRDELQKQLASIQTQIEETQNDYDLVDGTMNNEPAYRYATLHSDFVYKLKLSNMKIPETKPLSRAVPKLVLTTTGNSVKGNIIVDTTPVSPAMYMFGIGCCLLACALIFEILRYFKYIDIGEEL